MSLLKNGKGNTIAFTGSIYAGSIGFALGIIVRFYYVDSISLIALSFLVLLGIIILGCIRSPVSSIFILSSICILGFVCGVARLDFTFENSRSQIVSAYVGQTILVSGIIIDEPTERAYSLGALMELRALNNQTLSRPVKVLADLPYGTKVSYGDAIQVSGKLQIPENFTTNTGKEFDYISYLSKDHIFYLLKSSRDVSVISSHNGNFLQEKLFSLKALALRSFEKVIPRPESSLLGGLVLGARESLGNVLRQKFITTGTIHIVALSGYNVTIVADGLLNVFRTVLPETFSIGGGIFAIILFALMTGGGSTVIRASIMAILGLIARATGRTYDVGRALILAGFFMIVVNPTIIVSDVSFQLSFLATIGLMYGTPITLRFLSFVPKKFGLQEIVAATLATNIFVLPFILYTMGTLSVVAIPTNILILPFIPMTMFFGFFAGIFSFFSAFFTFPFAWGAYLLLHYELLVINWFSNIPHALIAINQFPFVATLGIYVLFLLYFFRQKEKVNNIKQ